MILTGSQRRIVELNIGSARKLALRVFAATTAVYPNEWKDRVTEEIAVDLFEFAFHARRINQLCCLTETSFRPLNRYAVTFSEPPEGFVETRYDYALNRLSHAKDFSFGWAHADHRVLFTASSANLMPIYIRVATDDFGPAVISMYGLVDAFLTDTLMIVKQRHPELIF